MDRLFVLLWFFFPFACHAPLRGDGGGEDVISADMPFSAGYWSRCVQGANGAYSHQFVSTKYDLDLDTPNDEDDLVYAPMSGTAYVHDDGSHGFGRHVNLDLHDGTYLLMGHMKSVFISDDTDVAAGEILGFEGTTGNSSGDHVHYGRHSGDPHQAADYGVSLQGFQMKALDVTSGQDEEVLTSDAVCGLTDGHVYQSELLTAHWHPVGTFLKRADAATVYERVPGNKLLAYDTDDAFHSRGYSTSDVILAAPEELACYDSAGFVDTPGRIRALRDSDDGGWILLGEPDDPDRVRYEVRALGASGVLQSYGIRANTFEEIDRGNDAEIFSYPMKGVASYRDGSLLIAQGQSAVYVMDSGVAMPIESWDTYLLMGFGGRDIIRVAPDEFAMNVVSQGSCSTDTYCIKKTDVTECGHSEEVPNGSEEGTSSESGSVSEAADSGNDSADPLGQTLTVSWQTPDGLPADWITIAGTYVTAGGVSTSWDPSLSATHNGSTVSYSRAGAAHGDHFRFSVAYGRGTTDSWSCLAPYPPGTVQGAVDARVNGAPVHVEATADPNSAGCQLELTVP